MDDYEWRIEKDVEVFDRGLFKIKTQYLLEETDESHRKVSIRIISLPTETQNLK
jgi:hypothetical protein